MESKIETPQGDHNQIDILLSTYNGAEYLDGLVMSILNQTYQNWRLLIRDDGSTDHTMDMILTYVKQYPNKIIYIDDNLANLGPSQSFSKLMDYSNADFIMFCDQDDVWIDHKIELTLEKMQSLEEIYPDKPLLVHTDLTVVDKDLQTIANSFWSYQRLNPNYNSLNYLLIQNIATGCTMMMNKQLKDLVLPVPNESIMHDWWIALVASIYAGVYHLNTSTVLYRQHGENNIGAKKYSLYYFLTRYGKLNESFKSNQRIIKQAESLIVKHKEQLNNQQYKLVNSFTSLFRKNRFHRLIDIYLYRYRKHGILRNIGFMFTMFLWSKNHK